MLPPWRGGWIAVFVATFVFSALLGDQPFGEALRLVEGVPLADAWWSPLTAPFALPETALGYLGLHLGVQWFFGGRLEGFWGRRRYLVFALTTGVVGYLVAALALPLLPIDAGVVGGPLAIDVSVLLAFAWVFGRERYALPGLAAPLSARAACVLAAVASLAYFVAGGPNWAQFLPCVAALAAALLFVTQPWRGSSKSGKLGRSKKASHLRIVRSPDDLLH